MDKPFCALDSKVWRNAPKPSEFGLSPILLSVRLR